MVERDLSDIKVLVVDDEPVVREMLEDFLDMEGFDIETASGGGEALEILEEEGDTEYEDYYDQLNRLREDFSSLKEKEWKQNLYWRWLNCLLSLIREPTEGYLLPFMQNRAWIDKEIQTTLRDAI